MKKFESRRDVFAKLKYTHLYLNKISHFSAKIRNTRNGKIPIFFSIIKFNQKYSDAHSDKTSSTQI